MEKTEEKVSLKEQVSFKEKVEIIRNYFYSKYNNSNKGVMSSLEVELFDRIRKFLLIYNRDILSFDKLISMVNSVVKINSLSKNMDRDLDESDTIKLIIKVYIEKINMELKDVEGKFSDLKIIRNGEFTFVSSGNRVLASYLKGDLTRNEVLNFKFIKSCLLAPNN